MHAYYIYICTCMCTNNQNKKAIIIPLGGRNIYFSELSSMGI